MMKRRRENLFRFLVRCRYCNNNCIRNVVSRVARADVIYAISPSYFFPFSHAQIIFFFLSRACIVSRDIRPIVARPAIAPRSLFKIDTGFSPRPLDELLFINLLTCRNK